MVEEVEEVATELEAMPLGQLETLNHGQVPILLERAAEGVARHVAVSGRGTSFARWAARVGHSSTPGGALAGARADHLSYADEVRIQIVVRVARRGSGQR